MAFSSKTGLVAAGSIEGDISIWSTDTCRRLAGTRDPDKHHSCVRSMVFSPSGEHLVSGSDDNTIKIWHLSALLETLRPGRLQCIKTIKGLQKYCQSLAYTPDGKWVLSGRYGRSVQLWDAQTGEPQFSLRRDYDRGYSIATAPQGGLFAIGSVGEAQVWSYGPYHHKEG